MSAQLQVTGEAKIRDIQGPVVANSGVITALNGAANQYVRGDGTLASFPTSGGGGSSVSYYLNGSVNQGTFGGSTYYQMSKNAIVGSGTNFSTSANGLIAQFITDANDPDVVSIPSGNWNVEFFMSVSASSGSLASFYVEIYKYNGSTFTLLATNVATPEQLTNTTTVDAYFTSVAMPLSSMAVTDRLAIRVFANVASKTVTLYTEDNRLCQVVTTFSKGMLSMNNLTDQSQYITIGTSGTNFAIVSSGDTHTFNLPVASATNTGKLSSTDWSTFNNKQNALTNPITGTGASGQVTFFNGTTSVIGSNNFFWDNTNSFLGVGTNVPSAGVTSFSTTPAFQFKAAGTAPAITFSNTLTSASLACVFGLATANNQFITGTAAGDMAIANQSTSAGAIVFGTGTTERMRMTSAGTLSIGNTNSTYKLDVTGIVRFTGELTGSSAVFSSTVRPASSFTSDLGTSSFRWNDIYGFSLTLTSSVTALSLIKSGGTSSQFLMADGSVNTSVLPSGAYLPLTGGTLTGALSGTSATFSSTVRPASNLGSDLGTSSFRWAEMWGYTLNLNGGSTIQSRLTLARGSDDSSQNALYGWNSIIVQRTSVPLSVAQTDFSIIQQGSDGSRTPFYISSGGNVGIGTISPASWGGGYVALQTSSTGTFASNGTNGTVIGHNFYYDGTNDKYITSGVASRIFQFQGNIRFELAASGSAGANLSFSEAMRITSGGAVGIGTSNPQLTAAGRGVLDINGSSNSVLVFSSGGTYKSYIYNDGTNLTTQAATITFETGFTERMRITSGGKVGIGTSSVNNEMLTINQTSGNSSALLVNTSVASGQSYGLTIQAGTNSSDRSFAVFNQGGSSEYFSVRGDGYLKSPTTYNNTTASPNYLSISTSGFFERFVASSARYKEEIKDWDVNGLDIILALRPRTYKYKKEYYNKADVDFLGLIAEEVAEVNTYLADYENEDGTGQVENVRYATIVVPLIKAVQELEARIKQLENK